MRISLVGGTVGVQPFCCGTWQLTWVYHSREWWLTNVCCKRYAYKTMHKYATKSFLIQRNLFGYWILFQQLFLRWLQATRSCRPILTISSMIFTYTMMNKAVIPMGPDDEQRNNWSNSNIDKRTVPVCVLSWITINLLQKHDTVSFNLTKQNMMQCLPRVTPVLPSILQVRNILRSETAKVFCLLIVSVCHQNFSQNLRQVRVFFHHVVRRNTLAGPPSIVIMGYGRNIWMIHNRQEINAMSTRIQPTGWKKTKNFSG